MIERGKGLWFRRIANCSEKMSEVVLKRFGCKRDGKLHGSRGKLISN